MKPLGLNMGFGKDGLALSVTRPTRVEDAVWEAVEEAIAAGWTPERFRNEAADAWRERLQEEAKDAAKILSTSR